MVIFLKGVSDVLNYFIECMAGGEEAYILNTSEPNFFLLLSELEDIIDETTDVITFNNVGILLTTSVGENYWEQKNVKLHNIYVDAPIWYREELKLNLKCMQIITIDSYHKEFVRKWFPNYGTVQFLPHGGVRRTDIGEISYEDRRIDVLYVGGRRQGTELFLSDSDRELFELIRYSLIEYPYLTIEEIFDLCMEQFGINLPRDTSIDAIAALYMEVLLDVRGYYQGKVVEALAKAGIHVDIYNRYGWEKIGEEYPDYVHVHEIVDPEECIRLMYESKITLNILPWFKYGAHERIYNAMLNGSVCVSDTSEYLIRHFENGKNIIFYELNRLDELVKNVKLLLENSCFAQYIIENQKIKVANSTWKDRLANILEQKFEEGIDFI